MQLISKIKATMPLKKELSKMQLNYMAKDSQVSKDNKEVKLNNLRKF